MTRNDTKAVMELLSPAARYGQLAEECAELAQVALKLQRLAMKENPPRKLWVQLKEEFTEEVADVLNALSVAEYQPRQADIMAVRKMKMARWAASIANARMEEGNDG